MNFRRRFAMAALLGGLLPVAAMADSGLYIGASAGGASIGADFGDVGVPDLPTSFDEDDTAYKLFGGYRFDLPLMFAAAEFSYVDFGSPDVEFLDNNWSVDTTGFSMFGIAGLEIGPVEIFGKLGGISWDLDARGFGERISDDGFDFGIGAGVAVGLGPISIRGEYEYFDAVNGDISMLSVGATYLFD